MHYYDILRDKVITMMIIAQDQKIVKKKITLQFNLMKKTLQFTPCHCEDSEAI